MRVLVPSIHLCACVRYLAFSRNAKHTHHHRETRENIRIWAGRPSHQYPVANKGDPPNLTTSKDYKTDRKPRLVVSFVSLDGNLSIVMHAIIYTPTIDSMRVCADVQFTLKFRLFQQAYQHPPRLLILTSQRTTPGISNS